jgi:hypothetical protein
MFAVTMAAPCRVAARRSCAHNGFLSREKGWAYASGTPLSSLGPPFGRGQETLDTQHMTAGSDHHGPIDPPQHAGKLRARLRAQSNPPVHQLVKTKDQRVAGESMASGKLQLARCIRGDNVKARERRADSQRPWAARVDIAAAKRAGHYGGRRRSERLLHDTQRRVPHHQRSCSDRDGVLVNMRKIPACYHHDERFYEDHTLGQPKQVGKILLTSRAHPERRLTDSQHRLGFTRTDCAVLEPSV